MSLLLEALKKAEKAKEEAQRRARGDSAAAGGAAAAFDPDSTVADPGRHVTTRDQLPDISAPLEIVSDDLKAAPAPKAAPRELTLAEEPPAAPPPPPREARTERRQTARAGAAQAGAQASAQSAERATAQRVFEAKFKEPNPRVPFFITMGLLSAFAIGTVVYFWIQLRPPAPLVNTNPARPADEKPVDVAAAPRPPGASPAAEAASATAIPGLPGSSPAPAAPAGAGPAPVAAAAPPAAPAASTTAPAPATPATKPAAAPRERSLPPPRGEERAVSVNRGGPQIHPLVASGYAAYQAGDLAKARSDYQQALRDEATNRDALLGLAAVEMRSQRYDLADSYYRRILLADPRDPHAQAGMIALRGQQLDPVQVESRMKSLIAADRTATVLQFTLGNQYAQQGRWSEAQQAYFKAFAADPENPDFAFNLAVSLDQLHQTSLALEYYRRALALAQKRTASFPLDAARTRVQQLSR